MPYYKFNIDGRIVIEAESKEKAKEKFQLAEGMVYVDSQGQTEPYKNKCQVCGNQFETFVYSDELCSEKCKAEHYEFLEYNQTKDKAVHKS